MPGCQIYPTGEEKMIEYVQSTGKSIHIKPRLDDCGWDLVKNSPSEDLSRQFMFETSDRLLGITEYGTPNNLLK